jgi:hypothetical protein
VAQGGKDRFLQSRPAELAAILSSGVAVVLADVRGTGETAAAADGTPLSLAQTSLDLNAPLMGARVKDLRTVLAWARLDRRVDARRLALWGESFTPPNREEVFVDELEFEAAPGLQFKTDPLGAHLVLFTALYEPGVKAVGARGGLTSYQSMLDGPFTYVPMDAVVHGILKETDLPEIVSALAPRKVLRAHTVDGRNVPAGDGEARDIAMFLRGATW